VNSPAAHRQWLQTLERPSISAVISSGEDDRWQFGRPPPYCRSTLNDSRHIFLDKEAEYGLIAAGISIAIIAVVNGLGTQLNSTFSSISTQLQ
jgi:hypothetical protein